MIVGITQIFLSSVFFSILFLLVKLRTHEYSVAQLAFVRAVVNGVFALALVKWQGHPIRQPQSHKLIFRGLMGSLALLFYFRSLSVLDLNVAVTINSTTPIFVTLFLLLTPGPKPTWASMALVLLGFGGILVILKPDGELFNWNGIWGLLSVISLTAALITLHSVSRRYPADVIVLYFMFVLCAMLIPFWPEFHWPTEWTDWAIFAAMGLCAGLGQSLMTRAFSKLPLVLATQFQQISIVLATLLSWLVLNTPLTWKFGVGALIVIAATLALIPRNALTQKLRGN